MKNYTLFLFVLFLLTLVSCQSVDMKVYVEADESTYDAISEEYVSLVDTSTMTAEEKDRRKLLVKSWKQRIDNAKKSLEK